MFLRYVLLKYISFCATAKKNLYYRSSGTAIGALIREAAHAQSKADFLNKMNVALKEANETIYWLMLLKDTDYINIKQYDSMQKDCNELLSLLVSIVKSTKETLNK